MSLEESGSLEESDFLWGVCGRERVQERGAMQEFRKGGGEAAGGMSCLVDRSFSELWHCVKGSSTLRHHG